MGKDNRPRHYDKPHLANHVSKYALRHPEHARDARQVITEEEKPGKKKGPQENPIKDFQNAFLAEVKDANLMDYPTATRTVFLNVLQEAVMTKSTRMTLQNPNATGDEFARAVCEMLYRRTRDHAASGKDLAFTRMLEGDKLVPELKQAVTQFTAQYFATHGDDLKSALKWQRSEGR